MAVYTTNYTSPRFEFLAKWKIDGDWLPGTTVTDEISYTWTDGDHGNYGDTYTETVFGNFEYTVDENGKFTSMKGTVESYALNALYEHPNEFDRRDYTSITGIGVDINLFDSGLAAHEIIAIVLSGDDQLSSKSTLWGYAGNDTLIGSGYIDGGSGHDIMSGGGGSDTYIVDDVLDVVKEVENTKEDIEDRNRWDDVRSTVSYTLPDNVELLTLLGTADIDGTGNSITNYIEGNSGNNILDGKGGADGLFGGLGDDTYYVGIGDFAYEGPEAGGYDRVYSEGSYTLLAGVEELTLAGPGKLNGWGNKLDNVLRGNTGNNRLDGDIGADTLIGGKGDDTYIVDNAGDRVVETPSSGKDLVSSSVSYSVAGIHVEELMLTGTSNINATGNGLANKLTGNAGDNVLDGGAGNDKLYGRVGADQLHGGTGADTFVFAYKAESTLTSRDVIYDFSRAQGDKIHLVNIDANTKLAGNQAFTFIGEKAFSHKAGELRYLKKDGDTFVHADLDGNASIDFTLKLDSLINLNAADFFL